MTPILFALLSALPGDPTLDLPTSLSLAEPDPQAGRAAEGPSNRVEINVFLGAVVFDGDFDSDPFASGGVMLRIPTPFLPSGRFPLFGEAFVSKMERDVDPLLDDNEGVFFGGGLGLDFQLYRSPDWFLLAQGGGVYISFGDIIETDDGFGGLLGLMAGFHPLRRDTRYAITINPQWTFDGDNWLLFIHAGLNIRF